MKICLPLNLFNDEMLYCGCGTVIGADNIAYIVKSLPNIEDKRLVQGDSGLAYCGECLTKYHPEFKTVKSIKDIII